MSHKPSGHGLGRQLAAMSARAGELVRWIGSHVLRRRAAQLVVLLFVSFLAGLAAIFSAPLSSETRIVLATAAGFVLFGCLLLYLGYRSWDLARRLSREATKSREMLAAVKQALATQQQRIAHGSERNSGIEKMLADMHSRQSSFAQALGAANSNWLATNARAEQSSGALGALVARLQGIEEIETALLRGSDEMTLVVQDLRRQQSAYVQGLGATNAQMLETASRSERLSGALESQRSRIDKLDIEQARLVNMLGAMRNELAAQAQANEAQDIETIARFDASGVRLARLEQDLSALSGASFATGNEISEMAALQQLSIANLKDLIVRMSAIEQQLDAQRSLESEQFDELAQKTAMLEAMSHASQERLLSDLARARAAASERDAAIAAAASDIAERLTRTEAAVLILAEQGDEPWARLATLEQHIVHVAQSSEGALDELLAQLASLKEFVRNEAGQFAANVVAVQTLGSEVEALSTQMDALKKLRRVDGDQVAAQAATLRGLGDAMDALFEQLVSLKDVTRLEADRFEALSTAIDRLGTSVEYSLGGLTGETARLAKTVSSDSVRVDDLEQSFGALRFAVESSAAESDLVALRHQIEESFVQVEAMSTDHLARTLELAARVDGAQQTGQACLERAATMSAEIADLRGEISASASQADGQIAAVSQQIEVLRDEIGDASRSQQASSTDHLARTLELAARVDGAQQTGQACLERAATMSAEIADLRGEISASASQADGQIAAVSQQIAVLRDEIGDASRSQQASLATLDKSLDAVDARARDHQESLSLLQATVAADAERLDALTDMISALRTVMEDAAAAGDGELEGIRHRLDDLSRGCSDTATSSQGLMEELAGQLSMLREVAGLEAGRIDALTAKLAALGDQEVAEVKEIRASLAELTVRVGAAIAQIEAAKDLPAKLAEVQAALTQNAGRTETFSSKFTALLGPLEKSVRAGEAEVDIVKKGLADLSRSFGASTSSSRQVIEQLSEQMSSLREAMTGEFGRVGTLGARIAALHEAFEDVGRADGQWRSQTIEQLAVLSGQVADTAARLDSGLAAINVAAAGLAGEADLRPVSVEAGWYEPNNRHLRTDHVEVLEADWTRRLSLEISRPAVGYMTGRIAALERELDGRLRAPIEDTLLRTLIARSVKSTKVRVLELGASFGVETAVMYDQVKDHFADVSFTIVDPLDSIARNARTDRETGLQVSERIVRRNLGRVGLAEQQVSLVRRSSTDVEAIAQVSGEAYDVLIIDGDHSYAGVKADFENYSRMVRLGGYVIFAEYGAAEWPEVQDFVDREVSVAGHTALVGASWRTAVYRVVRAEKAAAKPATRAKPSPTTRRKK